MRSRLRSWVRSYFQRSRMEREMDLELRDHIERYTEDLVRGGLSRDDARRKAGAEFGSVEARKEDCRQQRGLHLLDELHGDLRYAVRLLKQSPVFTCVAVLSLALGIGANSALFSLMETVLWRPIGVKNPSELRLLSWVSGPKSVMSSQWGGSESISFPVYRHLLRENAVFEQLFAFKPIGRITAVVDGNAELVLGELVSGNFYEGIGISAAVGRAIGAADDTRSST